MGRYHRSIALLIQFFSPTSMIHVYSNFNSIISFGRGSGVEISFLTFIYSCLSFVSGACIWIWNIKWFCSVQSSILLLNHSQHRHSLGCVLFLSLQTTMCIFYPHHCIDGLVISTWLLWVSLCELTTELQEGSILPA